MKLSYIFVVAVLVGSISGNEAKNLIELKLKNASPAEVEMHRRMRDEDEGRRRRGRCKRHGRGGRRGRGSRGEDSEESGSDDDEPELLGEDSVDEAETAPAEESAATEAEATP